MNAKLKAPAPPNLPQLSASPAQLKVTKGPYKGVVYKLVSGKITIGRSSENDIALAKDDKVSRKQALLTLEKSGQYVIKDLSNRASLKLNNAVTLKSELQDGDLIQCGATVLQFSASSLPSPAPNPVPALGVLPPSPISAPADLPSTPQSTADPLSLEPAQGPAPLSLMENAMPQPHVPPPFSQPIGKPNKPSPSKNKQLRLRIIIAVIALVAIYLYFSDSGTSTPEKEDKLRTQEDKEKHIKTLQELEQKETKKRERNKSMDFKQAQFFYIKGIRDYRKGVYNRAVESFRACKTMDPQHKLCPGYLEKAQAKSQQLIQAWMITGKAHREKRRFAPCMASFKNVMTAIKASGTADREQGQITYKEAYENYKICQLQYEDRY